MQITNKNNGNGLVAEAEDQYKRVHKLVNLIMYKLYKL